MSLRLRPEKCLAGTQVTPLDQKGQLARASSDGNLARNEILNGNLIIGTPWPAEHFYFEGEFLILLDFLTSLSGHRSALRF